MAQKDQEKTRKSPALALMDHWNKTNPEEVSRACSAIIRSYAATGGGSLKGGGVLLNGVPLVASYKPDQKSNRQALDGHQSVGDASSWAGAHIGFTPFPVDRM